MKESNYSMTYFHLGDLNPVISGVMSKADYENYFNEPGSIKARYLRYLKTNLGVGGNKKKLFKLLSKMDFCNIENADGIVSWDNTPVISL